METRARYVIIGAFTLVVIVLAFGFIYWLKRLDETGIRSTIYFEFHGTVGGLAAGERRLFRRHQGRQRRDSRFRPR